MTRTALAVMLLAGTAMAAQAQAQEASAPDARQRAASVGTAVAAVVNDAPISTFDVQQRLRLMMASSGAQLDERALAQLQQQALRDLIEERLKLQEFERFEQTVAEEEIDAEVARIASSGGGTPQTLARDLAGQGIALETLRQKIRADIAWEQLVGGRYGSRVNITEAEVEDEMATMRARAAAEQYLLAEICLPVDDPSRAEEMRDVGMQMIGQMQQGVPFRALAQQYSSCPSAARGGDLGWVAMEEVRPALRPVVPNLSAGNVSLPVEADGMVVLLALRQKRDAALAGEPSYEVAYAGVPKAAGIEAAQAVQARMKETNACASQTLSVDLGPDAGVTALPMLPASAFEPAFRPELAGLGRGEVSGVMEGEDAYHVALMCQRDEGLGLPSRAQVRSTLRAEALDRLSRRYLRDVERDSAVDVRLGEG